MNQHQDKTSKTQTIKPANSNSGNFKNNPQRAAEAGRKGGEHSHSSSRRS